MQLVEALFGETFTGIRQHKLRIIDTKFLLPSRVEERRVDCRHASIVRVRFRAHVESASTRTGNHGEALWGIAETAAVDMNDVQRDARDRRPANNLAD